ncbi:MAG: (d)CMP kinase [Aestuariivirgaceae bacterium]
MIIAIDGPAASGKGTLSRQLAAHYGLKHLDTGSLYRAVALAILRAGGDPANEETALEVARQMDIDQFGDGELRDAGIGEAASVVAAMPQVRKVMLERQRAFAAEPPGAVLDGRDIGTIVCPDADVKLFITASADIRARRRYDEALARGQQTDYDEVLGELKRRDERDTTRAVAPLKPAADAHLLDTSELDIETAFQAAVQLIDGST